MPLRIVSPLKWCTHGTFFGQEHDPLPNSFRWVFFSSSLLCIFFSWKWGHYLSSKSCPRYIISTQVHYLGGALFFPFPMDFLILVEFKYFNNYVILRLRRTLNNRSKCSFVWTIYLDSRVFFIFMGCVWFTASPNHISVEWTLRKSHPTQFRSFLYNLTLEDAGPTPFFLLKSVFSRVKTTMQYIFLHSRKFWSPSDIFFPWEVLSPGVKAWLEKRPVTMM